MDPHDVSELALLRRLARVNRQFLQAEQAYFADRNPNNLKVLRDLKHQMRRLLEQHRQRWGENSR